MKLLLLLLSLPVYSSSTEPHIYYSRDGITFTENEDGTGERYYVGVFKDKFRLHNVCQINLRTMMITWKLEKHQPKCNLSTMADEILIWEEILM